VLDVHTSPNVPPIPPHATFEQVKAMTSSVLAGDEDRWSVVKEGIKTKLQEFLPHRNS
jgi:pyruvate dehydrogenase (quinone)